MSATYFLGIDIGSTGTKTVLLEQQAGIAAQSTFESPMLVDGPAYAEADADVWVQNAINGIRVVLAEAGVNPESVKSIATTGMVPAVVCLNDSLQPVRHPILQNDARATTELVELATEIDNADMLSQTGSALTQQSVAPTLRWLQRYEPETWSRTRHVVGSYDYMLIALGAPPHVEENWAIESGLFTLTGAAYAPAIEAIDLGDDVLPAISGRAPPWARSPRNSRRQLDWTGPRPWWSEAPITSCPPTPREWTNPATG